MITDCWYATLTYFDKRTKLIIGLARKEQAKLYVSIPEFFIKNIPHYFVDATSKKMNFYLWDNKIIGEMILIIDDKYSKLINKSVKGIKEKVVTLNKLKHFEHEDLNLECGDFQNLIKNKITLVNSKYRDKSIEKCNYCFDFEHEELKNLNKIFNNSEEDTLSKAIKIMRKVHKLVVAPGMATYIPKERSGLMLLEIRLKKEITLNCRGIAIILNDALLSVGIKSKIVVCMSDNPYDVECHVTNSVFIPELNKWIMLDSALQSFVIDKNKKILSIEEVRNNLVRDEKLTFMTNLKNENIKLKFRNFEEYLYKNMYCFLTYEKYGPYCDNWGNDNKKYLLLPKNDNSLYREVYCNHNVHIIENEKDFFI